MSNNNTHIFHMNNLIEGNKKLNHISNKAFISRFMIVK